MPSTAFVSSEDLPLASEDATVEIEVNGAKVQRKVFAGTRVPAELVDVWRKQTGAPVTDREKEIAKAQEDALAASEALDDDPDAEKGDPAPARRTPRVRK
jgi:hypothetical protein